MTIYVNNYGNIGILALDKIVFFLSSIVLFCFRTGGIGPSQTQKQTEMFMTDSLKQGLRVTGQTRVYFHEVKMKVLCLVECA